MGAEILKVDGLSKQFGKFLALDNLSFSISRGEIVGFLGQNGAGKSTTIKILCSLIHPSSGDVLLDGVSILGRNGTAQRKNLGVIVEAPRFYPHLSGRKNLTFIARLKGVPENEVDALLGEVGLKERAHEKFGKYSMGMKQRLGLAAVLLGSPALVVLDEPTTGLDPVGREQIHQLILSLAKSHKISILLCSHLLSEVETLCSRALVMHGGKLLLDQPLGKPGGMAQLKLKFQELANSAEGEI